NSTDRLKKAGLDSKGIQKLMAQTFEDLLFIEETLPSYVLKIQQLVARDTAFRYIHFPSNVLSLQMATARLKFEELFFMQLKVLRTKAIQYTKFAGPVFKEIGERFSNFYHHRLPFQLTSAQKRV